MTATGATVKIMSRVEALARGERFYFTGKPCKRGGIAFRAVSNRRCQCNHCIESHNDGSRLWYQNNREAIAGKQKRYRGLNHEKSKISARRYRERNREKEAARKRRYRLANPEKYAEYARRYRRDNKDNAIRNCRISIHESKDKKAARKAKRRAAKRRAVPLWFSEFDQFVIEEAYALAAQREAETGFQWHVDHMIPLQARNACGLHCADNIQVIPAEMNMIKRNSMMFTRRLEWLRDEFPATSLPPL